MLHQPHPRVARPALAVVVADHVLVVRVGVLGEVPLDEVLALLRREPQQDVQPVHVAGVEADGVARLGRRVGEAEEVVWHGGRARELGGAREAEDEEVARRRSRSDQVVLPGHPSDDLFDSSDGISSGSSSDDGEDDEEGSSTSSSSSRMSTTEHQDEGSAGPAPGLESSGQMPEIHSNQ